jgi:hypothetical protein
VLTLDLALTGDLAPVLVEEGAAIEFLSPAGVRVLRYGQLYACDATGSLLPSHLQLVAQDHALRHTHYSIQIIVDDTSAVYPITVDPLVTTPDWAAEGNQAYAGFSFGSSTAGDVNGDGYSDVLIGAERYDNGQTDEGRVFVYYGGQTGLSSAPDWTAEGDQSGALFGRAVGPAGDVNGDGYADVAIGANFYDNGQSDEGAVFVYYGSPTGLDAGGMRPVGTPNDADWRAEGDQVDARFGFHDAVTTAGDVDGNGYSDLLIGAPFYDRGQINEGAAFVFYGGPTGLDQGGTRPLGTPANADWVAEIDIRGATLGQSANAAGDVNGDGYADVVVSAPWYDGQRGLANVYYGSSSGLSASPDWQVVGEGAGDHMGLGANTAGDVNGDGYADVLVGAAFYGPSNAGRFYIYHGGPTGLSPVANWTADGTAGSYLGNQTSGTAGDVNGDGYADVITCARHYSNGESDEGAALIYFGSATGLDANGERPVGTPANADWLTEGNQVGANHGSTVGPAGDVNGDGYADVLVGAYGYDGGQTNEGRAYLYLGGASGLRTDANWSAEGNQAQSGFSHSSSTAGDVNGDGYTDVLIGADYYDNGQVDEGAVFAYYGGPAGLALGTANWMAESNYPHVRFGRAVGTAGDVNGDGYSDVVVGAPGYSNGQGNEGAAFVYYGSRTGLDAEGARLLGTPVNADWTVESDQVLAHLGAEDATGTAGDVNGDGYADLIIGVPSYDLGQEDEGVVLVYHGSSTGLDAHGARTSGTPANADWIDAIGEGGATYGRVANTAGDVNGDGYADVIVSAPWYDGGFYRRGLANVYHGSASGLSANPDWQVVGWQNNGELGLGAGTAGDVNGDGFADVIVAVPYYDHDQNNEGRVYIYHGGPTGLAPVANWTAESDQGGITFGSLSAGTAGDVNGDGYADVIVGARHYTDGQDLEGAAVVFYGSATGLDANGTRPSGNPANADWLAQSDQAGALFGAKTGTAGDVNGDGYADVIVGAYEYDNGQTDEGAAFVFYGNGGGLGMRPRQMRADGAAPLALLAASDALSAMQLRLTGRMPLGRAPVKMQWQAAPPDGAHAPGPRAGQDAVAGRAAGGWI